LEVISQLNDGAEAIEISTDYDIREKPSDNMFREYEHTGVRSITLTYRVGE